MEEDGIKKQEARFLKDVADHEMSILRDDGLDRHVRFRRPNTICYSFDVITWAGHLIITGDFGTWVFARAPDMFDFFRIDRGDWNFNRDGGLSINPGYWSEKLLAVDARGRFSNGPQEFSEELFEAAIKRQFDEFASGIDDPDEKASIWAEVEEEVLNPESEEDGYARASRFNYKGLRFTDMWEYTTKDWTPGFIWNLHAIVYGISKYDEAKAPANSGIHVAS